MSSPSESRRTALPEETFLACTSYLIARFYFPTTFQDLPPHFYALAHKFSLDSFGSIDAFQARYTSLDNKSFEEILERMNQKKREKWKRFFGTEVVPMLTGRVGSKKYLLPGADGAGEQRLLGDGRGNQPTDALTSETQLLRPNAPTGTAINRHATDFTSHSYARSVLEQRNPSSRRDARHPSPGQNSHPVPMTPTILPTGTPLFTWGELGSTPVRLGPDGNPSAGDFLMDDSLSTISAGSRRSMLSNSSRMSSTSRSSRRRAGGDSPMRSARHILRNTHSRLGSTAKGEAKGTQANNDLHGVFDK